FLERPYGAGPIEQVDHAASPLVHVAPNRYRFPVFQLRHVYRQFDTSAVSIVGYDRALELVAQREAVRRSVVFWPVSRRLGKRRRRLVASRAFLWRRGGSLRGRGRGGRSEERRVGREGGGGGGEGR